MRKMVILLFAFALLFPAIAISDEEAKPTYKVTINLTYNALDADAAAELVDKMIQRHGKACEVEYRVVKNGGSTNIDADYIIRFDDGASLTDITE